MSPAISKRSMRRFLVLAAALSILFGFAKPITAGGVVSNLVHQYCSTYKKFPHFRAIAAAGSWQGTRLPWSVRSAAGQTSVKSAIYLAMSRCESDRKKYDIGQSCRLYFLGDIDVSGMSATEIERVKERYQQNRELTNHDLQ